MNRPPMCSPSVTDPAADSRSCRTRTGMIRHVSRSMLACWTSWMFRAVLLVTALVEAAPASGSPADPGVTRGVTPGVMRTAGDLPGRRLVIDTPLEQYATPGAPVSRMLYLERCQGGCRIHRGPNDARTNTSTIPLVQEATVGEFANSLGLTGVAADPEWGQIVQCMKEVYSPFNVVVTDVRPASGASYHEALIAGRPGDIGQSADILGLAPLANDCRAIDNVISFTFANAHLPAARVLDICWTAAQESAHAFGLDHEYSFSNNRSACSDPTTYRTDCGGEKFFRNEAASCGEAALRTCKCSTSQNSHQKLLSVFGAGTPITGPPTIVLTSPTATGGTLGSIITAQAGAKRGVARVEVFFNGFPWAEAPGAMFGRDGQPDPSDYTILVPDELPDSIVDVKAVAHDDLGASAESAVVTVTKGAPCETAATCAAMQRCEAGKCFWDPPVGELGDSCTYPQFCKGGICVGVEDQPICTQACNPGVADACPSGFACATSSAGDVCVFASSGAGCCSASRGEPGWLVHGPMAVLALAVTLRKRRRLPGLAANRPNRTAPRRP